jgi:hypothetical protein
VTEPVHISKIITFDRLVHKMRAKKHALLKRDTEILRRQTQQLHEELKHNRRTLRDRMDSVRATMDEFQKGGGSIYGCSQKEEEGANEKAVEEESSELNSGTRLME